MGFAPRSNGDVSPYDFVPTEPQVVNISEDVINDIKNMAHDFWERVKNDERISVEFKDYLERGNPIDLMWKMGHRSL